jgi:hypothetical protein
VRSTHSERKAPLGSWSVISICSKQKHCTINADRRVRLLAECEAGVVERVLCDLVAFFGRQTAICVEDERGGRGVELLHPLIHGLLPDLKHDM